MLLKCISNALNLLEKTFANNEIIVYSPVTSENYCILIQCSYTNIYYIINAYILFATYPIVGIIRSRIMPTADQVAKNIESSNSKCSSTSDVEPNPKFKNKFKLSQLNMRLYTKSGTIPAFMIWRKTTDLIDWILFTWNLIL